MFKSKEEAAKVSDARHAIYQAALRCTAAPKYLCKKLICNLRAMVTGENHFWIKLIAVLIAVGTLPLTSVAQGNGNGNGNGGRPFQARTLQNFQFGAFAVGTAGGQLRLSPSGVRTATGTVVPLNLGLPVSPLLLEIRANSGTIISVLMNNVQLTRIGGGGSMTLSMGNTNPASPFVFPNVNPPKLNLYIGGNLTVGNTQSVPPGNYSGTLNVTFMLE